MSLINWSLIKKKCRYSLHSRIPSQLNRYSSTHTFFLLANHATKETNDNISQASSNEAHEEKYEGMGKGSGGALGWGWEGAWWGEEGERGGGRGGGGDGDIVFFLLRFPELSRANCQGRDSECGWYDTLLFFKVCATRLYEMVRCCWYNTCLNRLCRTVQTRCP